MSTEPGGEAAVVETTNQAAPEAALSSQDEVNFETEARKMGWVPEDEFKGDKKPAKFLSAEEYYRRGEEVIPIIRARNKDLEKSVEELKETNKRMSAMFEKTIQRERENANRQIEALKAEKKTAIQAQDADRVEEIDQKIDALKEEAKPEASGAPVAGTPAHNALIKDFATANSWFVEEPDMHDYAIKVSESNAALNEEISFEDNMKFVLGAVRKKFPSYFKDNTQTAANGHAAVDTGGDFPGAQPKPGPASKLNATERVQADKDIAAGLFKTRDEWAKIYFAS